MVVALGRLPLYRQAVGEELDTEERLGKKVFGISAGDVLAKLRKRRGATVDSGIFRVCMCEESAANLFELHFPPSLSHSRRMWLAVTARTAGGRPLLFFVEYGEGPIGAKRIRLAERMAESRYAGNARQPQRRREGDNASRRIVRTASPRRSMVLLSIHVFRGPRNGRRLRRGFNLDEGAKSPITRIKASRSELAGEWRDDVGVVDEDV